jgi:hypothetical protein
MAEHGGYRTPSHPAPVSGPGAHSARTDRGPKQYNITGGGYGDAQEFQQQQASSPLAPKPGAPGGTAPAPVAMPTPMHAPSEYADQPVTAGADAGMGPSMADIGLGAQGNDQELRSKFGPMLPMLRRMADSTYATDAFKAQVRELEAKITG